MPWQHKAKMLRRWSPCPAIAVLAEPPPFVLDGILSGQSQLSRRSLEERPAGYSTIVHQASSLEEAARVGVQTESGILVLVQAPISPGSRYGLHSGKKVAPESPALSGKWQLASLGRAPSR